MKKIDSKKIALAVGALPQFQSNWDLSNIINWCLTVLGYLVPLLIGGAVVVFLYGVLRFIAKSSVGDSDGRKDGINFMIFGIVGIAVMVSVWGLVAFVTNTFGVSSGIVPQFPTGGSSAQPGFNQPGGAFGPTQPGFNQPGGAYGPVQ